MAYLYLFHCKNQLKACSLSASSRRVYPHLFVSKKSTACNKSYQQPEITRIYTVKLSVWLHTYLYTYSMHKMCRFIYSKRATQNARETCWRCTWIISMRMLSEFLQQLRASLWLVLTRQWFSDVIDSWCQLFIKHLLSTTWQHASTINNSTHCMHGTANSNQIQCLPNHITMQ